MARRWLVTSFPSHRELWGGSSLPASRWRARELIRRRWSQCLDVVRREGLGVFSEATIDCIVEDLLVFASIWLRGVFSRVPALTALTVLDKSIRTLAVQTLPVYSTWCTEADKAQATQYCKPRIGVSDAMGLRNDQTAQSYPAQCITFLVFAISCWKPL